MAVQKLVVRDAAEASPILPMDVALVNEDGTPVDLGGGSASITSVKAMALAAGAAPTATLADGVLTLGIPAGAAGAKGDRGEAGAAGAAGAKGADGKSVTAIALTADATGKVTGGTATLSDKSTVNITVTTATA